VPILLHDAPMSDHLSVGVQTWGSAILLGREMALRPSDFGLSNTPHGRPVRVLELGAGTGLLSILCRKLLDLENASASSPSRSPSHSGMWNGASPGLVVATDFLPSVLDNLKICVDLNFPPVVAGDLGVESGTDKTPTSGIHIAKLDWTTFPSWAARRATATSAGVHSDQPSVGVLGTDENSTAEQTSRFMDEPFDLVLASDCVYDETHAAMLRQVAGWVLRLPDPNIQGDVGGTFVSHTFRLLFLSKFELY
jgi:predicted nicotinamide N-methyase